jgi:hypothetical protein
MKKHALRKKGRMPRAKCRKIVGSNKSHEHREPPVPYGGNFTPENGLLRLQNTYYWVDIV